MLHTLLTGYPSLRIGSIPLNRLSESGESDKQIHFSLQKCPIRQKRTNSCFACGLIVNSPVFHSLDDRLETHPGFGQRIFHTRRHLRIDLAVHQPITFHLSQIRGKHLLRNIDERRNSLNRLVPSSKSRKISTFHLSEIIRNVV